MWQGWSLCAIAVSITTCYSPAKFISDENHENDHDDNDDMDKVNDNGWSYKWLSREPGITNK